ncbi:hypothetical protein B5P46_13180 [Rhizobium leguminosarum]|uniref:Uncharacterized protein n=1 Tax=Rhizobium leguminosarum TaxID=384 RepID=A0A4Q1U580_RHILE|nr:hypothetical protein B5P46_13180 [Rhizobium leguminosarum]
MVVPCLVAEWPDRGWSPGMLSQLSFFEAAMKSAPGSGAERTAMTRSKAACRAEAKQRRFDENL